MKSLLLLLLFSTLGFANPLAPLEEVMDAQWRSLDIAELIPYIQLVEEEFQEFLPPLHLRDLVRERGNLNLPGLLSAFLGLFFREVTLSVSLLRQLLILGILTALLRQLESSFGSKGVGDLAFATCFLWLTLLGLLSFQKAVLIAKDAMTEMVSLMQALLPLMATLLAAVGGITTAALFHPLLLSMVSLIASLVHSLLFPLLYVSAVLGLLANFSHDFPLSGLASLVRQAAIFFLSFCFVLFSGVMVVRGAIAPVMDGVALRTAKFLTKTFIPVLGGMFADATEAVIGGSLLLKNGIGVFGLGLIFFMAALPIVKLAAIIFIYKLVGALLQPLCDPRIVKALQSLENALVLVTLALLTVALMFFLSLTILIGFGNLTVFLR